MQYTVEMKIENGESKDSITMSLNTDEEKMNITSYGATMNFQQFITFADVVQELREKFAIIDGKRTENQEKLSA